ncbi:MAG: hypothetical protein FWF88_01795 [Peptococcaceae bacterium]|nr:hypothetical protein [Peptococcaceae bacterium]
MQIRSNNDVLSYLPKIDMSSLKVGQKLPVEVLSARGENGGNAALIRLGGRQVEAQMDTPVRQGDRFWVAVRELSDQALVLSRGQNIPTDLNISPQQMLVLLSRGLPPNLELAALLDKFQNNPQQLVSFLRDGLDNVRNPELKEALSQLLQTAPQWENLSSKSIVEFLRNLGVQHENQLLNQVGKNTGQPQAQGQIQGQTQEQIQAQKQAQVQGRNLGQSQGQPQSVSLGQTQNGTPAGVQGGLAGNQSGVSSGVQGGMPLGAQPETTGAPVPPGVPPEVAGGARAAGTSQGAHAGIPRGDQAGVSMVPSGNQTGALAKTQTGTGVQVGTGVQTGTGVPTGIGVPMGTGFQIGIGSQPGVPGTPGAATGTNQGSGTGSVLGVAVNPETPVGAPATRQAAPGRPAEPGSDPAAAQMARAAQENDTVKAKLMKLLETSGRHLSQGEQGLAKALLDDITAQQLWLQSGLRKNAFMLMNVPLQDQEGLNQARIAVESARKGAKMDSQHCRIAVQVDTFHLGTVGADVWLYENHIHLCLLSDDPAELTEVIQPELVSAQEQFQALGMFLASVTTKNFADMPRFKNFLAGEQLEVNIEG